MTARRAEIAGGGMTQHRLDPTCTLYINCVNIKVRCNILCYLTMYGALFAAYMLCVVSRCWVFSMLVHLARCGYFALSQ